ncbi:hypothetical protein C8J56DRAFT_1045599 [Mycena floridula]|nr:hypothetical protein C8J56DRAFT_1045599 [Mycena floridula]
MVVAAPNNTVTPNWNRQQNPAVPQNPVIPAGNAANPIRGRNQVNLTPAAIPRFVPGPIQPIPPFNPQNQAAVAATAAVANNL